MKYAYRYLVYVMIVSLVSACAALPKVSLTDTQDAVQKYCSIGGEPDKPFVAGWAADERQDLLRLKAKGAVLLSYKGCIMKVLSHCHIKGKYQRTITTADRKKIEIGDSGMLYSQLPMGARSLSAKVEGGRKLQLSYVMNATDSFEVARSSSRLEGRGCEDATHYVEVMYLGAFRLRELVNASGGVNVLSGGGQLKASASNLDEIGNIDRCNGDQSNRSCLGVIKIKVSSLETMVTDGGAVKPTVKPVGGPSYGTKVDEIPKVNVKPSDTIKRSFEEKLQRIRERKERKIKHKKSVEEAWKKVSLKRVEAERKLVLVIDFINRYRGHELGNFREVDALELKGQLEQEIEQNNMRLLMQEHKRRVRGKLDEVRGRLNQGGRVGKQALDLFLAEYARHELGNPLEDEARELLQSAERRRLEQHEQEVRRAWQGLSGLLEGKDGVEAVELFLDRFEGHELGNPLEDEARALLSRLKRNEDVDDVEVRPVSVSGGSLSGSGRWRSVGMKAVRIPGGSFMMGSNDGDSDEKPVHRVQVGTFYLSKTEVTVGQYRACVKAGVCSKPVTGYKCNWNESGREDHPINCVDWNQARKFAQWVGGDLPTEAQWEYAARSAGKDWKYPWGNETASCDYAIMFDGGWGCGKDRTWPICSKPRGNTKQGLCDMAGNLYEWVRDGWQDNYNNAPRKGFDVCSTPTCRQGGNRVFRGGGWNFDASYVRAADRSYADRSLRYYRLGFRVLLSSP